MGGLHTYLPMLCHVWPYTVYAMTEGLTLRTPLQRGPKAFGSAAAESRHLCHALGGLSLMTCFPCQVSMSVLANYAFAYKISVAIFTLLLAATFTNALET